MDSKHTFIGEDVIFDTTYPEDIIIESGVGITAHCVVLSHFFENDNNKFHHFSRGEVIIKRNAYIGTNMVICKPVTIGEGAIAEASSVVTKDIPPFEIWAGNPARFIRKKENNQTQTQ